MANSPANRAPSAGAVAVLRAAAVAAAVLLAAAPAPAAAAEPSAVNLPGSFQDELGCPGDWQPDCPLTFLGFDEEDAVWQGTHSLPAGSWEYKAALDGSWTENYGLHATRDGANIPLALAAPAAVKFYYSHATHWITDGASSIIATAPGSYQSELGCAGDWDPGCLRSWLQDPDGDGVFSFRTRGLAAGDYEVKVAIAESWAENYGAGGVPGGANVPFTVPADCVEMEFVYDGSTHLLTVGPASPPPQPASATIAGSLQSELGCPGDWQADCALTHLAFDPEDAVWQGTFTVPAGAWEYKATLNDSWDENYGLNATRNGPNVPLNPSAERPVEFYYDHATHWVTDGAGWIIATAPGSYQSELGCAGDWDPGCLRSWLQDPDGDGLYSFSAHLPAGDFEVKVAHAESWDENYGAGGVPNGANIPFSVPTACAEVFFTYDPGTHLLTVGAAGAPRGNLALARAHWLAADLLAWRPADSAAIDPAWSFVLHSDPDGGLSLTAGGVVSDGGGVEVPLAYDAAGLPPEVAARFPHLAGYAAFRLPAGSLGDVPELLRGQLAVSAVDAGELMDATSLQIPGVLDDLYAYDGPLGVMIDGGYPTLAVWAPTAHSVALHLFADSDPATAASVLPMTLDPATGVWSVTGDPGWLGRFYLYEVEVWAPSTRRIEHNLVTDPYSLSLAINSARSQIVDLDDPALAPSGWDDLAKPPLAAPEDVVLYELHVRDFSATDDSVPAALRGTFGAFAVDSDGTRHLAALADAGLTHVHLLPSFDFATVDEDRSTWLEPAGDLSSYPPDSELQQAAVMAVADRDGFNWGYDPWHYTVPEGSYAADPDGAARILEFRSMVQALAGSGLRVVMDVVYNHTNASGQNARSVLDRVVPGYYHRLDADGRVEHSTCCENTASEHAMMEKLIVDSVVTWAREHKVDGFRFDLMGHHMKSNMLAVRAALDALTLEADGVDGPAVYVYGEGWNFGEVADNARGVNAVQRNMAGTGIGSFNDRLRDGARGGGPFSGLQEQGFVSGLSVDPNATPQGSPADQLARLLLATDWIRVGLAGNLAAYELTDRFGNLVRGDEIDYNGQPAGYTADPQEVINYVEAHDNETLFDALQAKLPLPSSLIERARSQYLGMDLLALGQGVPFFHAGVDLLRSKSMDRNSYDSGDWFNRLDFTYQSNNWGAGLPPARDNQGNWPIHQPLLADPALEPGPAEIAGAVEHFREVLAIRKSSPLFRLGTAQQVAGHLSFHNTGPGQVPALVVMELADPAGAIDRPAERIVVLFNARPEPVDFTLPGLSGEALALHPVQAASTDPWTAASEFDAVTGTFSVPERTTAVFVQPRPVGDQLWLLIGDVDALIDSGALPRILGIALKVELKLALFHWQAGRERAARALVAAFIHQLEHLVWRGVLTEEQADPVLRAARAVFGAMGG